MTTSVSFVIGSFFFAVHKAILIEEEKEGDEDMKSPINEDF